MATLEEARWVMVSRRQFAEWCVAALDCREKSYDRETNAYTMHWSQAVAETVPEEWREPIICLMTAGYADIWDWCVEQGVVVER